MHSADNVEYVHFIMMCLFLSFLCIREVMLTVSPLPGSVNLLGVRIRLIPTEIGNSPKREMPSKTFVAF
jgi:hypothetical protein